MELVDRLEQEHMEKILNYLSEDSCQSCCSMLRKLKESLIRFKKYLEGEGAEM